MLKDYFKIAFRSIFKYRGYSFINMIGLTLGITAAVFIWQYVYFERSYETFHSRADRIYRLPIKFFSQGVFEIADAMNYAPTGPAMKEELPEVEEFVRISPEYGRVVLSVDERKFEESKIYYADSTLFEVFDFELLEGDRSTCLVEPGSIVLPLSVAERYFGPQRTWVDSPVGQSIRYNNKRNLLITGIMADVPRNSHIKFGALISFTSFIEYKNDPSNHWGWNDFYTYVLLREDASRAEFEAKIPEFILRHKEFDVEGTYDEFIVQPIKDIHLTSNLGYEAEANGDGRTVGFLSIIGLAVLIIAWVNYINLATARAEERAREVGVRKVIGASRQSLIFQFLTEALILNMTAVLCAVGLIQLIGPLMKNFIGVSLPLSLLNLPLGVWTLPGMILLGTLLSGLYPAFILSAFAPSQTLKGSEVKHKRGVWVRKSLVVFQYAVSVILIIGTFVVYRQLQFMQNQDLGFGLDQTLVLNAPSVIQNDSIFQFRYQSFKSELEKYPSVRHVTASSAVPGKNTLDLSLLGNFYLVGTPEEQGANFLTMTVEENFVDVYDLQLVAGRSFSKDMKTDHNALIINETSLKLLGLTDPEAVIGQKLQYWDDQRTIVGVLKDYHHRSLKNAVEPLILRNNPSRLIYFSIKFDVEDRAGIEQVIKNAKAGWDRVYPDNPFNYFFLDEHYNEQYLADNQLGKIAGLFALLTVLIACLGLFGLASYTVTVRAKEIGIRKVLGASATSIIYLFSKGYLQLLALAFLMGVPAAYYLCLRWLENYSFAAEMNPLIFIAPCLLVLLIALLAVSSQSIQAAAGNPVEALRKE